MHFVIADFVPATVILLSNQYFGLYEILEFDPWDACLEFCWSDNGFEGDSLNVDLISSVAVGDCDIKIPVSAFVVTVFKHQNNGTVGWLL